MIVIAILFEAVCKLWMQFTCTKIYIIGQYQADI